MSEKRKKAPSASKVVPLRANVLPPAFTTHHATITGRSESEILVDYLGNRLGPLPAMSTVLLSSDDIDSLIASRCPVLVTFESEQPDRPIVVGLTQPIAASRDDETGAAVPAIALLRGKERIELRCGEASVILTKEGKVIVNGSDVLLESEGSARIRGAVIELA